MKQADVRIGMKVYCTDWPGSNRSHMWTVKERSPRLRDTWVLTRKITNASKLEELLVTAISRRLRDPDD